MADNKTPEKAPTLPAESDAVAETEDPGKAATLDPASDGSARSATLPADDSQSWMSSGARSAPEPEERYQVQTEVARGGLGRVLLAEDRWLRRQVVLKELHRGGRANEHRFRREALLTARLDHPAIVPIHDAGTWSSGQTFYSMRLVGGRSLGEAIAECGSFRERIALLPHVRAVAEAIAYAHSQRVIHRDLKPQNVMVGAFGETLVIDWGLAKDLDRDEEEDGDEASFAGEGELGATATGAVLGTPAYMSPEQARGEPADERSDVYSLGALLYHVLTGSTPYEETGSDEILGQVAAGAAPPVRERAPELPPDLAALVDKAMAVRAEDRYATAGALLEDLKQFETGKLVSAHSYSVGTLLLRWLRRHRAPVAVAAAAAVVLSVGGVMSVRRILREREAARASRDLAERRADDVLLSQARTLVESDTAAALAALAELEPSERTLRAAREISHRALGRGIAVHRFQTRDGSVVQHLAFSSDSRWLFHSAAKGGIAARDLSAGTEERYALPDGEPIVNFAVAPDDGAIAAVGQRGTVARWERSSKELTKLGRHEGRATYVRFDPEGAWLATAGDDGLVRLWGPGGEARSLEVGARMSDLEFSEDGTLVAIAANDGRVRAWEVESGEVRVDGRHEGPAHSVAIAPDASRLASGGADRKVRLWPTDGGPPTELTGHRSAAYDVVFSPDGALVASSSEDKTVRLWSVEDGSARVLAGHVAASWALRFPDQETLVSSSFDGTVRLWDPSTGDSAVLRGHKYWVTGVASAPNGLVASGDNRGGVRVWRAPAGRGQLLARLRGKVHALARSADGRELAVGGFDGSVGLTDLATRRFRLLGRHSLQVWGVDFAPDGSVVSVDHGGEVRRWDASSGEGTVVASLSGRSVQIAAGAGGRAAVATDGGLCLIDLDPGGEPSCRPGLEFLSPSPDRRRLAVSSADGDLHLLGFDGAEGAVLPGRGARLFAVQFGPRGERVAACAEDEETVLFDLESGRVSALPVRCHVNQRLTFSPGGERLAVATPENEAVLIDLESRSRRVVARAEGLLYRFGFSADGRRLASAGADGAIRIADLKGGEHRLLSVAGQTFLRVEFLPEQGALIAASVEGQARLWSDPPADPVPAEPGALEAWLDAFAER